jgi:hypothetical protein
VNTTFKTALKTEGFIVASLYVVPVAIAAVMYLADGTQRGGLNDSHLLSIRYTSSVIVLMALVAPIFWFADRRKPGTPLTWGEAMVAAVYIFFLFFWLFGIVPHEFLTWADSELAWTTAKKFIGPDGSWASWWSFWKKIPITVDKQKVRDTVAVLIYGVGLGGLIWFWSFWQNREAKATEAAAQQPVSAYGRPLAKVDA